MNVLLDHLSQSSDERVKKSEFLMRNEIEATLAVLQGTSILGKLSLCLQRCAFFFFFKSLPFGSKEHCQRGGRMSVRVRGKGDRVDDTKETAF